MQAFVDLASMTVWYDQQPDLHNGTLWRQPDRFSGWAACLLHRCLELSPRTSRQGGRTTEACHPFQDALRLAILLFLAPTRRLFGVPVSGSEMLLAQMRSMLEFCTVHYDITGLQKLVFWMLVVGGMEAATLSADATWFCSQIVRRCASVGATESEEISDTIERAMVGLVWLDALREPGLRLLMESMREYLVMSSF